MSERRVPCLDHLFDRINILLWPRFKMILDFNMDSLASLRSQKSLSTLSQENVFFVRLLQDLAHEVDDEKICGAFGIYCGVESGIRRRHPRDELKALKKRS